MTTFQESTWKRIQNISNETQGTAQSNSKYFVLLTACRASKSRETATQETAEGDFCLSAFWEEKKKKKRVLHRQCPTMRLGSGQVMPHPVFQERKKWHSREVKHRKSKVGSTFCAMTLCSNFPLGLLRWWLLGPRLETHIPCRLSQPECTQWKDLTQTLVSR